MSACRPPGRIPPVRGVGSTHPTTRKERPTLTPLDHAVSKLERVETDLAGLTVEARRWVGAELSNELSILRGEVRDVAVALRKMAGRDSLGSQRPAETCAECGDVNCNGSHGLDGPSR